ncbi:MAG TPA: hypothetical protein VMA09_16735 [Candidatus Binataceae bacterium]|nr:hypothetical protein [Candidatus Binataceae bacterium]
MNWRLTLALSLMLTNGAYAGDIHDACVPHAVCAGNPNLAGPCFELKGILRLWNGNPTYRISRTRTKRIVGVLCDEDPILPANLKQWLNDPTNAQWDRDFRGTYQVCPFTRSKPGVMQFVCVEKVSNLTIYDRAKKRVLHENERPAPK